MPLTSSPSCLAHNHRELRTPPVPVRRGRLAGTDRPHRLVGDEPAPSPASTAVELPRSVAPTGTALGAVLLEILGGLADADHGHVRP